MLPQLCLDITTNDETVNSFELQPDTTVFIGRGEQCGIVLDDPTVELRHCTVCLDPQGQLRVQDWNTNGKTLLDDQPVLEEARWSVGQLLRIGAYQIDLRNLADDPSRPPIPAVQQHNPVNVSGFDTEGRRELCDVYAPPHNADPIETVSVEPESAPMPDEFVYEMHLEDEPGTQQESYFGSNSFSEFKSGVGDGESDLQLEIEQLRFDVAARDAELRRLTEANDSVPVDATDNDETVRLVNRLEDLLEELHSSDDRISGLEELLRVSDEATRAEQEERRQLELWMAEIEQRVVQRESESKAELARAESCYNELKQHYRQAQTQLKQALDHRREHDSVTDSDTTELAIHLRNQVDELQSRVDALGEENRTLRQQTASHGSVDQADVFEKLQRLEQKYLELQVTTSRERAEMARQREQLERLKHELSQKLSASPQNDADTRFKAMREHLKEIHQLEQRQKKESSISGRITRLLSGSSR
jgi:pSer/pThr/pTyr-binding forkhead associated (FHA) protein